MKLNEFLAELSEQDVQLWLDGDQLRIRAPKGVLTPELRNLLAEHKAKLILLLRQNSMSTSFTPIVRVTRNTNLPLSFEQERLWIMTELAPHSAAQNITQAIRLSGKLNISVLEQSLNEILHRHEALRTTFTIVEGSPVQSIEQYYLTLPLVEFLGLNEAEQEAVLLQIADEEAQQPFTITQGPLLRFKLMQLNESDYVLLLVFHHLISDVLSVSLFIQELAALYEGFCTRKPSPLPEILIQYGDFAVWQRQWLQSKVLENQLSYWKKQLNDAPPVLELPTDRPRPLRRSLRGAHQFFKLSPHLPNAIQHLSHKHGVTPFMTLLAAFKVLLYQYSGQEDLLVGSPTSGRVHPQIESLIGFFAYPLVLRTNVSGNPSFLELLGRVRQVALDAYAHQDVPLGKIVEVTQPQRSLQYNPLFQVLFSFVSKQTSVTKLPNLTLKSIWETSRAPTDLDLLLSMYEVEEELHGVLAYNTDIFDADTIKALINSYCQILECCLQAPELRLTQLKLSEDLEAKTRTVNAQCQKPTLAITATFTAEPVADSLAFWMQELEIPSQIEFASYNQVFQQLLDPASLLAQNQNGINIVLLRFEDWVRFQDSNATLDNSPASFYQKIVENLQNLVLALKQAVARTTIPYLVCLCPAAPTTVADVDRATFLQQMETQLVAELADVSGVYLSTSTEIVTTYPVEAFYDPHGDELGHVPFTPLFFSTLGTMLARKIYTIQRIPYKVIVLDCDQTLWQGVCGEDGADGIVIDAPHQALQKFMVDQYHSGMLLCLCSKNNPEDVFQVFERHPQMPLQQQHLVSWRINWQPKSENLKSLAQELRLGLDSFIFIDDNPVECAEVQANCPEVLTLKLPNNPDSIPRFLQHIWVFDHFKITTEDRQRNAFYQQNAQRQQLLQEALTLQDFLNNLNIQVQITEMTDSQLTRVSQLTQRTNQFNATTIRRSSSEIQALCQSQNYTCLVVEVKDRFGDYGLVGVILFTTADETLKVDTLLLSCRVLGRGVEHQMLAKLGEIALTRGITQVKMTYKPTPKNQPILDFLNSVGSDVKEPFKDGYSFNFSADICQAICWEQHHSTTTYHSESTDFHHLSPQQSTSTYGIRVNSATLNRISNQLYNPEQIFQSLNAQKRLRSSSKADNNPLSIAVPRTPIEEILMGIWAEVLGVEQVGIYDNFFELGGHSLLATQLISRVRATFAVNTPLHNLFEHPTISGLAKCVEIETEHSSLTAYPPILPIARNGKIPLSHAQARLWFLDQLEPGSAFYNIPAAVRLSGKLDVRALEHSLNQIICRHEALRTNFDIQDGQPVQVIAPSLTLTLPLVDLQDLTNSQQEIEIQQLATLEAMCPFVLTAEPLVRATLLRLGKAEHILLLTMHHIISDGWSMGVLVREIAVVYEAFSNNLPFELPKLPIQYADFALWQRQWLQGEVLESQLAYWKQKLEGIPAFLELPTDQPRLATQNFRGAIQSFMLPSTLAESLKILSRQEGVTLFMTLLATFQILLHHYTKQDDIVVGTDVANRNKADIEGLIGFFVNQLVLRTNLSGNPTFKDLLARVREAAWGAYDHQDLPFNLLVEAVNPNRDLSRMPLFQVKFVLQNDLMSSLHLSDLNLSLLEVDNKTAKLDLLLDMVEIDKGLSGTLQYNTDLFEANTISQLLENFVTLLQNVVIQPNARLSTLEQILDEIDKQKQLIKAKELEERNIEKLKKKLYFKNGRS